MSAKDGPVRECTILSATGRPSAKALRLSAKGRLERECITPSATGRPSANAEALSAKALQC
jgi:hypothetical protein